jgi:hypothetical protein
MALTLNLVQANDCQEVNLYESSTSLNEITLYDQQELNTCYAYSAAQMWEHHFRNLGNEKSISPAWVALVSKINRPTHWTPDSLDFNYVKWTLVDMENAPVCSQYIVDRELAHLKHGNRLTESDLLLFIQLTWKRFQNRMMIRPWGNRWKEFIKAYREISYKEYFSGKLKRSLLYQLREMITYPTNGFLKYVKEKLLKECTKAEKLHMPEYAHKVFHKYPGQKASAIFNKQLEKNPVTIGYCTRIFRSKVGTKLLGKRSQFVSQVFKLRSCGSHYSVVVGQKKMNGQCHYLVRNSYGDMWKSPYRKCHILKDGKVMDVKPSSLMPPYKMLGCWISRDDLFENMFDISWIK